MRCDLEQLLKACDPAIPAAGDLDRSRHFVDRKDGFRAELAVRLGQEGARVLCVGQTGTGKTTELLKAAEELRWHYAVVTPPLDRGLDLSLLGWHDVMVFACIWAAVQTEAVEESEAVRSLIGIIEGERTRRLADSVTLAEAAKLYVESAMTVRRLPEPNALQRFRNEHQKIKERIAKGPAQVADLCRQAVAEIEGKTGKPLIVLLDGVEKVTMKVAKSLFYDEARLALDLPFRTAIVAPHGILHQDFSADLGDFFSAEPLIMRAVSCQRDEPEGRQFFRDMIACRGGMELVEPEALEVAIDSSGGIPRQFLTVISNAARLAIAQDAPKITRDLMLRGRERAMERFFYALRDEDYEALLGFSEDRSPGPRLERLLRLLAVIEYGKVASLPRLGINPLCMPLLKRHQAAHAPEGAAASEAR
ncbi:MAG: hypothetical protein FJ291_26395 [Planctomycetes bacterium]|nr:hypothetical protein [Planctomycetota bacterium]